MCFSQLQYKNIQYLLALPENADKGPLPTVLFLHGAGSRGTELSVLKEKTISEYYRSHRPGFVLIEPLCSADSWFDIFEQLLDFTAYIRSLDFVDKNRLSVTGNSMGGYACWQLAMSRPDWFCAAAPVCGGGMYWNAGKLKKLPVWAFHGALDCVVLPEESVKMTDAVNAAGGSARLTIYPDCAHDSWEPAYRDEELYRFLCTNDR